jgi:hypothetical protein
MANTVTVLLNSVRDITFDVVDNSGKTHYVTIKGSGSLIRKPDGTVLPSAHLPEIGSYGITTGVDADLWAQVEKTYGSMSLFKKGFIKAAANKKAEEDAGEELSTKENGEEPEEPQEANPKKKRGGRKKAAE